MLRIHKEGTQTIILTLAVVAAILLLFWLWLPGFIWIGVGLSLFLLIIIIQFFRNPVRKVPQEFRDDIIAPADGKVVTIEKVQDSEYLAGEWIQVSIFMSPLNVHVNRHPMSGTISYYNYNPGKYLVAWHPKASTENEMSTLIYKNSKGLIKLRQIAGAMARRIVTYSNTGDTVTIGGNLGFIKFGSRVDLLIPTDATIHVKEGDKVYGGLNRIASFP